MKNKMYCRGKKKLYTYIIYIIIVQWLDWKSLFINKAQKHTAQNKHTKSETRHLQILCHIYAHTYIYTYTYTKEIYKIHNIAYIHMRVRAFVLYIKQWAAK